MTKNNDSLLILIVEDNKGDIALIEGYLGENLPGAQMVAVTSFREAEAILKARNPVFDLILLDLSLPDKSGEALIEGIISICCGAPVIALTGNADIKFSIRSISLGIADYLIKDEISAGSLYKSILFNIERKRILNTIEKQNSKLQDIAWIQLVVIKSDFHKKPIACSNGRQALDYLRDNQQPAKAHFIFLDINMPVMNGWEFLDAITRSPTIRHIFVCVVSSSITSSDRQKAYQYPEVVGYLEKPVSIKDLVELKQTDKVGAIFSNNQMTHNKFL